MELGNLCFGNSRGNFQIERSSCWEAPVFRLFRKCGVDESYGGEFENDTFFIFSYYWGECTCGWDQLEFEDCHDADCYQSKLDVLREEYGEPSEWGGRYRVPMFGSNEVERNYKQYVKERTAICKKLGLDPENGSEVHCDCGRRGRFEEWFEKNKLGPGGHSEDCPIVRPNFRHKPSGFEIQWYKYPLRDSYMNMDLSIDQYEDIFDACVASLKQ